MNQQTKILIRYVIYLFKKQHLTYLARFSFKMAGFHVLKNNQISEN